MDDLDIYSLDNKYYQKLGEVWDHETKDFKVLYKPLYYCESKMGSFEAHYLAVSTFVRWNSKFLKINNNELQNLQEDVKCHIVSFAAVKEFHTRGLSSISYELPDVMKTTKPSILWSEDSTANVENNNDRLIRSLSLTDSGFGSRSLKEYFTMDFALQFKDQIINHLKVSTTRVLDSTIIGSEPYLERLVTAVLKQSTNVYNDDTSNSIDNNLSTRNIKVRATTNYKLDEALGKYIFGIIEVYKVVKILVKDITLAMAKREQFDTIAEFVLCLRSFYPTLSENHQVFVFDFRYVGSTV